MAQGKRIPQDIKEQILHRIRTEGITAAQAAKEHGVSTPTVYSWLSKGVEGPVSILQLNKLKRENAELKRLLGQAMLMNERSKKNNPHYGKY